MSDIDISDLLGDVKPDDRADGAYDGASRTNAELALWAPAIQSADDQILGDKDLLDSRSNDSARNDAYIQGGVTLHKDNIVGSQYVLNAKPDYQTLGLSEEWSEMFQEEVEQKFSLWAESPRNFVDAQRRNTLTSMVRIVTGLMAVTGEALATVEWDKRNGRPFGTCIQLVDIARLSNPNGVADSPILRGGVQRDPRYGEPVGYHIRNGFPGAYIDKDTYSWSYVPVRKRWGRKMVIHLYEQSRPDQSRAVSEMVAALKSSYMRRKFSDMVLQSAVLNATYAATIESELPSEQVYAQLGAGGSVTDWAEEYLSSIQRYASGAKNLQLDRVKFPHLYPGTKLRLQNPGTPGGVGTNFEASLLRHIAAALGVSYEQLSRDYTQTNYSSARAAMAETWKFMQARKKLRADAFANEVYWLWLEEAIYNGMLDTVPRNAPDFWTGLNAEAYCACEWIGAARGQIDELKETQASVLKINNRLTTRESEMAKMHGTDWRRVMRQIAREERTMKKLGIEPVNASTDKPAADNPEDGNNA